MPKQKHPQQRPEVAPCYDHLSGLFGEVLVDRLVELGWLEPPPDLALTEAGRSGLAGLGVDLGALDQSRRVAVARCVERRGGRIYFHMGGHLGALLRRRLQELGWIRRQGGAWAVTGAGWKGLQGLGSE